MNAERWDAIGRQWLHGQLEPANGRAAWTAQAQAEAAQIAEILAPSKDKTLLEVGCGIARLTPWLAGWFKTVIAIDTSPVMLGITAAATSYLLNVETWVADHEPDCDAALVWGNLYDEDWSDTDAAAHLGSLVIMHEYVLVQSRRETVTMPWYDTEFPIDSGDDWLLLHRPP